jgi:hypothetical protein
MVYTLYQMSPLEPPVGLEVETVRAPTEFDPTVLPLTVVPVMVPPVIATDEAFCVAMVPRPSAVAAAWTKAVVAI